MNTDIIISRNLLDEAIKLSATYFDENKTSKLLILISDGEDHSEEHKQQKKLINWECALLLLVLAKRRNNSVKTNGNCSRIPKRSK
jgi:hypothetical protein